MQIFLAAFAPEDANWERLISRGKQIIRISSLETIDHCFVRVYARNNAIISKKVTKQRRAIARITRLAETSPSSARLASG